jgi:hypothetical protein
MSLFSAEIQTCDGAAIYAEAENHPGVAALRRFNDKLSEEEVARERLLVFFASMTAFVRHITPGIPALASRLSDDLLKLEPYRAHGIAARILDASFDEYGLSGTKPHAELLRDFAGHFGLSAAEINDPAHAVPAAREIGERMFGWYRQAPLPFALGMHCASEVTGYQEAHGFYAAFLQPPKYGLSADHPDFTYVAAHVDNEEDHSRDVVLCLDDYLALKPETVAEVRRGCLDFMTLYERMFREMYEGVFDG